MLATGAGAAREEPGWHGDRAGDDALVRAARIGDRHAFEVLVARHGPAMYRYARRVVRDEGDAQEVVQDAFVAAWKGLADFESRSSLRTWLFTLTAHKAVDLGRKARARPIDDRLLQAGHSGPASDPVVHATQAEFLAAVELALGELPYRQRACWLLREVEGLSVTEVGEALSLSPGAVRGQLHRARRTLGGEDGPVAVTGEPRDPLGALVRAQPDPPPGWASVSASVVAAVRASTRRSWPVLADTTDLGPGPVEVRVADHVVRAELARAVGVDGACAAADVRLVLDGRRVVGVEVDVVGRWGEDLTALGPRVGDVLAAALAVVLGPAGPSAAAIGVRVVDVSPGDPRTG